MYLLLIINGYLNNIIMYNKLKKKSLRPITLKNGRREKIRVEKKKKYIFAHLSFFLLWCFSFSSVE